MKWITILLAALLLLGSSPVVAQAEQKARTRSEVVVPEPAPRPAMITGGETSAVTTQPAQPPIIVQPSPAPEVRIEAPKQGDFFNWVFAGIMSVIAAIFGVKTWGDIRTPQQLLTDPELRARIDEGIIRVLGTGIPAQAVTTALPAAAAFEPYLRKMLVDLLEKRATQYRSGSGITEDDLLRRLLDALNAQAPAPKPPAISHGVG